MGGGEEKRQRKKECVKDSRMDRATPGGRGGGVAGRRGLGLRGSWARSGVQGAPSVPPNRLEGPVSRIGLLWPGG